MPPATSRAPALLADAEDTGRLRGVRDAIAWQATILLRWVMLVILDVPSVVFRKAEFLGGHFLEKENGIF